MDPVLYRSTERFTASTFIEPMGQVEMVEVKDGSGMVRAVITPEAFAEQYEQVAQ